jgi:hypothetical protein
MGLFFLAIPPFFLLLLVLSLAHSDDDKARESTHSFGEYNAKLQPHLSGTNGSGKWKLYVMRVEKKGKISSELDAYCVTV